jgi:Flp pilus assembly protein TadG
MSLRRIASLLKSWMPACDAVSQTGRRHRQFFRNERGAVAIYFGLSAVVFVGVAGLAVDAARGYLVKARLSEAIDAAALAGGKALQTAGDPLNNKVKADALAFFNANFPNGAMGATVATPIINIANNNTVVTINSTAVIPTTLMRVLGYQNMTMAASASVARASSGLDVVFSFDVSGSMCIPCTKIEALKSNATALVNSLYKPFTSGGQAQMVTVSGKTYSLLNIGIVPWSSKINVQTHGKEGSITPVTAKTVATYADPTANHTGNKTQVYYANSSEVPLLMDPSTMTGGWKGCVYARYNDQNSNQQDDITLGPNATWPGWEPILTDEGENHSRFSSCDAADWNSGSAFASDGTPRPSKWPNPPVPMHGEDCGECPSVGILPLQSDQATATQMISDLGTVDATDAPQGLFWAWEVLMPGEPFDEAVVNPPFSRAQAIVLMTDGLSEGENGDGYHGWFGSGPSAGTINSKGNMTMPDGTSVKNNMDSRLLALAAKIKGTLPLDPGAVKIYVIQYQQSDPTLGALLSQVATQPGAPYYFFAPDDTALASIFDQIAASLSALRIVK